MNHFFVVFNIHICWNEFNGPKLEGKALKLQGHFGSAPQVSWFWNPREGKICTIQFLQLFCSCFVFFFSSRKTCWQEMLCSFFFAVFPHPIGSFFFWKGGDFLKSLSAIFYLKGICIAYALYMQFAPACLNILHLPAPKPLVWRDPISYGYSMRNTNSSFAAHTSPFFLPPFLSKFLAS